MKTQDIAKYFVVALFVLALGTLFGANFAGVSQDHHSAVRLFRAIAASESAIDLTTKGNFANKPSDAVHFASDAEGHGNVQVMRSYMLCGTGGAGSTIEFTWYEWRKVASPTPGTTHGGPAVVVCTGTATLGTQGVILFPDDGSSATGYTWADTVVISTQHTLKPMVVPTDQAHDGICKLGRDGWGTEWEAVRWTGGTATAVKVFYESN